MSDIEVRTPLINGVVTWNSDPARRVFCPNTQYSSLYCIFLIVLSVWTCMASQRSTSLRVWIVWNYIRCFNSIMGIVLCYLVGRRDSPMASTIKLFANWTYIFIYIAGYPLIAIAMVRYGLSTLPYTCAATLVIVCIDTLWLGYVCHYVAADRDTHDDDANYKLNTNITYMIVRDTTMGSCTICQEDYALNEKILKLKCEHIYHQTCITPWLKTQGRCPLCRNMESVISSP